MKRSCSKCAVSFTVWTKSRLLQCCINVHVSCPKRTKNKKNQSYFPFKIAICCQVLNCLDWMILCNEGWSCGRIGPFEVAPTDKKSNFAASAHPLTIHTSLPFVWILIIDTTNILRFTSTIELKKSGESKHSNSKGEAMYCIFVFQWSVEHIVQCTEHKCNITI